jgi:predicted transcriptional regulator
MTKRLEDAVATIRRLPDEEQDLAAELLQMLANRGAAPYRLSEDERTAVHQGLAEADRGEFLPDNRANDLLKRTWG